MPKTSRPSRKRTPQSLRKQLHSSLARLQYAELVRFIPSEDPNYIFKHALVQDIAYESLLRHDRAHYHRLIARILETQFANRLDEIAARLAQHYAEAGNDTKTAEFAVRAGDVAARAFASIEARANYVLALQALARLPDSVETRQQRIDTTIKYAEHVWAREASGQVRSWLEEMEELARTMPDAEGKPSGDRLRLASIHHALGGAYFAQGDLAKALPYFQLVLEEAPDSSDPSLIAGPATLIGGVMIFQGHFRQALPLTERAIAASRDVLHTWYGIGSRIYHAQARAALGQFEAARGEMNELLAQAQAAGYATGITMCLTAQCAILALQGDDDQAIQVATAALDAADASGDTLYKLLSFASKSLSETRLGKVIEARQDIEHALKMIEERGGRVFAGEWSAALCAQAALNVGEYEQAATLAQNVIAMEQQTGGIYASALARRVWAQSLAQLTPADTEAIDAQFASSISQLSECEALPELARTYLAWGEVQQARGNIVRAHELYQKAAKLFAPLGLTRELEQARQR